MAPTQSQPPVIGSVAGDFSLTGVDGRTYSLASFKEARALVVVFLCNHCPYVVAVQERINALAKEYAVKGVALIGINSNDPVKYPDDDFEAMKERAKEQRYVFPYVQDPSQDIARAYGAICTPDFFVYRGPRRHDDEGFKLAYAGRLDDNWKDARQVKRRELALALDAILAGKDPSAEQTPSMGCSIKWK